MPRKTKGKPDEIDLYVGNKLREFRNEKKLSQEKLAEAIGLTFQQIQKYERGLNRISAGRLAKFSKIVEQPIWLFYPPEYHSDGGIIQERLEGHKAEIERLKSIMFSSAKKLESEAVT